MIREFEENADGPDIILVSAAHPTRFPQAASLIRRIRHEWPEALIVLGSWGGSADELPGDEEAAAHGVEAVVATVSEAVAFVEGFAAKSPAAFQRAPIPGDESERLDALPTVSLTLVDEDSQVFLCSTGLPEVLREQGSSPRDESICGHVVGMNHRLVIEDTMKDRRFAGNPLLREHGLRFYAGVPVRAANGQPIGSLCVMDTKPRRISRADLRLLERTAKEVSERLSKPKPVPVGEKGDERDGEG
jgi:GAF domain-containing protein